MTKDQAELIVAIAEGRWSDVWAAVPRRPKRPSVTAVIADMATMRVRPFKLGSRPVFYDDYDTKPDPWRGPNPIMVESHTTIIFDDSIRVTSAVAGPLIYSDTIAVPDDLVVHLDFDAPQ